MIFKSRYLELTCQSLPACANLGQVFATYSSLQYTITQISEIRDDSCICDRLFSKTTEDIESLTTRTTDCSIAWNLLIKFTEEPIDSIESSCIKYQDRTWNFVINCGYSNSRSTRSASTVFKTGLLDSGTQSNFLTKRITRKLDLGKHKGITG